MLARLGVEMLRTIITAGALLHQTSAKVYAPFRPHVIYINLDRRADRRSAMEAELRHAGWPSDHVHRLSAVQHDDGLYGCNLSHRRAMELALANGWPEVLILEDDAVFRNHSAASLQLAAFSAWDRPSADKTGLTSNRRAWDVVLLAGIRREITAEAPVAGAAGPPPQSLSLRRVQNYQSAAAYLIAAHYLPAMIDAAARATAAMVAEGPSRHAWNSWDQAWKPLQRSGWWAHFEPLLADQAPGLSDITGRHADYTRDFAGFEQGRAALHAGQNVVFAMDWRTDHYEGVAPPQGQAFAGATWQTEGAAPPTPEATAGAAQPMPGGPAGAV